MLRDSLTLEELDTIKSTNWLQIIPVTPSFSTPGIEELVPERYGIPTNLTGLSILDVGMQDGGYSFLAEDREGIVTSINITQKPSQYDEVKNAHRLAAILRSNVEFYNLSFYYLPREWRFDYIFFFNILNYMDDSVRALRVLREITKRTAIIVTEINEYDSPVMEWLYKRGKLSPRFRSSYSMVESLLQYVGFQIQYISQESNMLVIHAV